MGEGRAETLQRSVEYEYIVTIRVPQNFIGVVAGTQFQLLSFSYAAKLV